MVWGDGSQTNLQQKMRQAIAWQYFRGSPALSETLLAFTMLLALTAPAAAGQQSGSPMDLGRFSVEPPNQPGWHLINRGPGTVTFGGGTSPVSTKVAAATLIPLTPRDDLYLATTDRKRRLAELASKVQALVRAQPGIKVISMKIAQRRVGRLDCVRNDVVMEDRRGIPKQTSEAVPDPLRGMVLILTQHEYWCLSPDEPYALVEIFYSQRASSLNELPPVADGEAFIESLVFNPAAVPNLRDGRVDLGVVSIIPPKGRGWTSSLQSDGVLFQKFTLDGGASASVRLSPLPKEIRREEVLGELQRNWKANVSSGLMAPEWNIPSAKGFKILNAAIVPDKARTGCLRYDSEMVDRRTKSWRYWVTHGYLCIPPGHQPGPVIDISYTQLSTAKNKPGLGEGESFINAFEIPLEADRP